MNDRKNVNQRTNAKEESNSERLLCEQHLLLDAEAEVAAALEAVIEARALPEFLRLPIAHEARTLRISYHIHNLQMCEYYLLCTEEHVTQYA